MVEFQPQSLTSPLHDRTARLGARFAEFGGWSMPLEYSGTVKEHAAVRSGVGVFDVSHLGKATVRGPGAGAYVNRCLTNDLDKIGPGAAQYTLCCADDGGVVDDLIAYVRSPDEIFLIPNAANTSEVVRRLTSSAPPGIDAVNQHQDYAIVAVQGRSSAETLAAAGLPVASGYMSFVDADWEGAAVTVCRTGYTGERGYELVIPADVAGSLWDAVLEAGKPYGAVPAGLAARDTLRTEMGYPLHGQDLSRAITPVQARLGWAVGWKKETFWGADALREERASGPRRVLRGLVAVGRGIPRPGMQVFAAEDAPIGEVTSGTFSPTLRKGIALALLGADAGDDGDEVYVDVRGRRDPFVLRKPPFVRPEVPAA